jgi:hypothetical protein
MHTAIASSVQRLLITAGILALAVPAIADDSLPNSERAIYPAVCSSCHGADGRGASPGLAGLPDPVPDFTDCDFAAREPDSDWVDIAYEGGASRGFSEMMPAFQGVLTVDHVRLAVNHIRSFCTGLRWPRGELDLPRPLITGKAYPEDEAVITTFVDAEGTGSIFNKLVYEQRFGPRKQWELVVPFGWLETPDVIDNDGSTRWGSSMGDIAFASSAEVIGWATGSMWRRPTVHSRSKPSPGTNPSAIAGRTTSAIRGPRISNASFPTTTKRQSRLRSCSPAPRLLRTRHRGEPRSVVRPVLRYPVIGRIISAKPRQLATARRNGPLSRRHTPTDGRRSRPETSRSPPTTNRREQRACDHTTPCSLSSDCSPSSRYGSSGSSRRRFKTTARSPKRYFRSTMTFPRTPEDLPAGDRPATVPRA